ncbi:MAG: SUMF1/EgtB/PvdO family nonheme iron enzyme [Acidobacteria bacterium]|nr:SUMF1/EgtB/PvdO family nonheme iron enzyme [Acidobacteriota bacterium]
MLAILLLLANLLQAADGFIAIRGGALPGNASVRVDDFEMAEHPVTNAEYKRFVEATGYAAPLHWESGRIPAGMENHPVVFVNRHDVAAYLEWRGRSEGRVYRLPAASEFEYAAQAQRNAVYPWGDGAPGGKANYDAEGNRTFAQWRTHLKAVKSYAPNPWGLYDMAGNVWQMVDRYPDVALARFKYRIERPEELEGALAGGSWARAAYYLKTGVRGSASAGIRHPDIGFRLVRAPAGSTHFLRRPRRLIAAPAGPGSVFLSWQLLPDDSHAGGFHVYRTMRRDAAGERLTREPVRDSTTFVDRGAPAKGHVYYRVRFVGADGREGAPSEWTGVEASSERTGLVAAFEPTVKQGGFVPVFGDLDGDGTLDAVLRLDNGIREMSRDPGVPVELEAFTSHGRSLWRRPLVAHDKCFGNANNVPVVVWDLNGDGKSEVIARLQEGDALYLAVLEGMTGRVLRKTKWTDIVSDFAKSSTRVHMSVAYLDGRTPAILTQTGLYENEIVDAYDPELKRLWQYRSFAETNGSGSHHLDIADLDGDGRDEVLLGTTALNGDGKLRWSIYREHPDIVAVKRFLPDAKARQVFYAVESSVHAGAYLVDAPAGRIVWKVNREDDPRWTHAHTGWAADIFPASPGIEMLTNRDGHIAKELVLFAASGKILADPFPTGWYPVNWTGGATRELMSSDGKRLGRFNGSAVEPLALPGPNEQSGASCRMVADLAGDYRDEVVCIAANRVWVYTNTTPAARRQVTRTASREYRLWMARNMGGGYPSYFEWEP